MSTESIDRILDLTQQLAKKEKEAADKLIELTKSLRLQQFYPEAFSHGTCRTGARGNLQHYAQDATFYIKLGNGEQVNFPILDVPYELWPEQARQNYLGDKKSITYKRKLQRLIDLQT